MPRIAAPTVAEHHSQRRRALLDAAERLLLDHGSEAVTPGEVGRSVGLQRSSVYKYFASSKEMLAVLIEESFSSWAADVTAAVTRETTPTSRIDAYARATLELAAIGRHHIANALSGVDLGPDCRARIGGAHRELMGPLHSALAERGDEHPDVTAALVQGVLDGAIRLLDAGRSAEEVVPKALDFIHSASSQSD